VSDTDHPFRPRAITPLAAFDTRPKLTVADPFDGVPLPSLRRPSNMGEVAERIERELRDTDTEELTPAARPFEIRVEQRLEKLENLARKHGAELEAIKKSSQDTAQHALDTHALVKDLVDRQRTLELETRWVPRLAWLVTTAIAVLALLRTYR
jgi:hypothetical protein